jgi:ATP-dependent Clp protease adaptor protein ClpS
MSDRPQDSQPASQSAPQTATGVKDQPAPARLDRMPPFRVLLHNDDKVDMEYVVETICELTPVEPPRATTIMLEAHTTGVALVLTTHRERAELYQEQFKSKRLTVTIEPAD